MQKYSHVLRYFRNQQPSPPSATHLQASMMRVLGYLLLPGLALGSHCEGSTVPGYCCSIGCDTAIDLTQYGMTQPTCSTGDATLADIFAVASADNCDPLTEGSCAWDSSADAKCVSQGLCPAAVPPATMGCVPGVLAGAPSPPDSSRFYSMSSTRCARAFVSSPLYTALGLPDPSYPDLPARTFMECSKACAMDEKCDWFIYSPDEDADQPCVMYKDAYPFGYYSTIAEMVWSKGGGDPNCVLTDTYLGQPIFGGNTRCPLEEDVGNGCTNFAVSDCRVACDTNPEFAPQTGRTLRSKHLRRMNASAFAPMVRIRCCFFSGTYPSPPRVGPTRHLRPPCALKTCRCLSQNLAIPARWRYPGPQIHPTTI